MNRFHYLAISMTAFSLLVFRLTAPPSCSGFYGFSNCDQAAEVDVNMGSADFEKKPVGESQLQLFQTNLSLPHATFATDDSGELFIWNGKDWEWYDRELNRLSRD